jgi:hypothetical protein
MRAVSPAVSALPFAETIITTNVVGSCAGVTATIALPLTPTPTDRVAVVIDGRELFGEIECRVADLERIGAAICAAVAAAKRAKLLCATD